MNILRVVEKYFDGRAYLSYLRGSDVVVLDITDKAKPKMIAHIDFLPPSARFHTTVPFPPFGFGSI